jgi:lipopolysaccharide transport system ATP-binding protein
MDLGIGFQGALRVRENVLLYGVLLGVPRARLVRELDALLDEAGVTRFADAPLERLSTGMRMRLAFTIALRAEADLLLVDEALVVGDEHFQEHGLEALEARKREGRTALLVSHDPRPIGRLCDRVLVLRDGRVAADGPAKALLSSSGAGRSDGPPWK